MPHTYQQILAAGAAHHLTYRQLDHWTRLGYLRTANGSLAGSGRAQQWANGEDKIAATMARLVTAGLKDLAVAHRIARGDIYLAPGITIHIHDRDHLLPPGSFDPITMPEQLHLTPGPLTDPALTDTTAGPVAA